MLYKISGSSTVFKVDVMYFKSRSQEKKSSLTLAMSKLFQIDLKFSTSPFFVYSHIFRNTPIFTKVSKRTENMISTLYV